LNFEHVLPINLADTPNTPPLTRAQLWEGLILRAEQPQLFIIGLERCIIHARTSDTLERELRYGEKAVVRDRVTLTPPECVRYDIQAADGEISGSLTMRIEEDCKHQLFLRFTYQTTLSAIVTQDAHLTEEIIKEAYRASDHDTVRLIREYMQGRKQTGILN